MGREGRPKLVFRFLPSGTINWLHLLQRPASSTRQSLRWATWTEQVKASWQSRWEQDCWDSASGERRAYRQGRTGMVHIVTYTPCLWNWTPLQTACEHKLTGVKDELKHINQELKKFRPEQTKVCRLHDNMAYADMFHSAWSSSQ